MAEWDFTKDPTPEDIQTFITHNKGGKDGKDFTTEDVQKFWAGQRAIIERAAGGPSTPWKRFKQSTAEAGKRSIAGGLMGTEEAPGVGRLMGMGPETAEKVGGGISSVVTAPLPETTGEAVMDALLLGRGALSRSGKLGTRLFTGITSPPVSGAGQAVIDYATGERTGLESVAQGAFRAATQGVGEIIGAAGSRGVSASDARLIGKLVDPVFPNKGTAQDLLAIGAEIIKPRRVYPNGVSRSLDDLENVVKMSLLPMAHVPSGYLRVPRGTGVRSMTVNRPAVGAPPGLTGAQGAGQVPFQVAAVEDVIEEIRHLRGQVRKALETDDPNAARGLIKWRREKDDLTSALTSHLTPSGQTAWADFDDLAKKAHAIQEMLKVGGLAKESTSPAIDLGAIHRELVNFKGSKTPLVKALDDAFKNEGGVGPILESIYRGAKGKFGAQDVSYGPLRVFSMLAGTGAAGGMPVGSVHSLVGKISGALPAVGGAATLGLGRLGREYMKENSSLIGSPEVQ